jgi:hypothetical protein
VLYATRLLGHYYLIAIDGTEVTTYYHPLLGAKLFTPTGFAFSLMTEFIKNPEETPTKQDCELKTFYRLADRLKQRFPRLPICLLLDGLYASGPTFTRCEQIRRGALQVNFLHAYSLSLLLFRRRNWVCY